MDRFALLLVSHTNVGKTTTARTLLGRDIGEVRDAAHVTQAAEGHLLVETPQGDRLELWDTPGFGDSVRLERRMRHAGDPIGWFLTEIWDRFRDRAFWSTQKALRAVVEQADVVLCLVNAAEPPEPGGPLDAEWRILARLGKPVLLLMNQLGVPQGPQADAAEAQAWRLRAQSAAPGCIREVLAFDAFARCWVQEAVLMRAVAAALPASRQEGFLRVQAAWMERHEAVFRQCVDLMTVHMVDTALDGVSVQPQSWGDKARATIGSVLNAGGGPSESGESGDPAEVSARGELAVLHQRRLQADADRMIRLHGLDGRATQAVLRRVAESYDVQRPVSEGRAALVGGVVTSAMAGAAAGLKVDLASGGLTLGGGMLAGALLGVAGGAGLARTRNRLRGRADLQVGWADEALALALQEVLLHYLAIAHYGRGRGQWREAEHPPIWPQAVRGSLDRHRVAWQSWLTQRHAAQQAPASDGPTRASLVDGLRPVIDAMARDLLEQLYPGSLSESRAHHPGQAVPETPGNTASAATARPGG